MTNERELLWESLPPDEPEFAGYLETFLGRAKGCPSTADLMDYSLGQAGAERAAEVKGHLPNCRSCDRWVGAFRKGLHPMETTPPPRSGSLLDGFSRPGTPKEPPLSKPDSLVLTGVGSMISQGRIQDALKSLEPILPAILALVGLEPALCDRLREFIRERLEADPKDASPRIPAVVKAFGESLKRDLEVPSDLDDWRPILFRGAVSNVLQRCENPTDRAFLQTALDRGFSDTTSFDLVRLEQEQSATRTVSPVGSRRLMLVVDKQQASLAPLFESN